MCDLIDLNSPKANGLLNSKLASPLIPMPRNVESNDQVNSLVMEKRESLGNNPFDNVLHETTEYIRKKDDPFEIVLQRALRSKSKKNTELKAQSVDFIDDLTPRGRRNNKKILDKTHDESLIGGSVASVDEEKKEEDSIVARNTNIACDNNAAESNKFIPEQSNKITMMDSDSLELSILNQSAMNDTLLEVDPKHKMDSEISVFLEKDPLFKEFVLPTNLNLKPHLNFQRSLSQGDRKSPRKLQYQDRRSQSITDVLRKASQSNSTVLFLNKDLESKQSQKSVFSNLSDISSTSRLNSTSLVSNLSSVSSNGIMNTAFMDNSCLNNERINTTENSMEIKSVQYDLSDLTERLNKLKCAIDRTTGTLRIKEEMIENKRRDEIDKSNSIKGENSRQITDNKLIDIEVFVPESSFNKEHNKSTNSTSSSDSVFTDSSQIDKSILIEAKALAKTFEELSQKTDSGSSLDDLISNNILWVSELLPAYEDETVGNLIELPVSPKKNLKVDKSNDSKQSSASIDNTEENFMKEMESQFTDNLSTVRQTMLTTLLLDLKKLVKAEGNPEASKLIDNLENALGVKCENNVELLANLNILNELQNSEMSDDKLDDIEQSGETSNNSQKENKIVLSEEKICDDESSLPHVSQESENTSQPTTISSDNSLTRTSPCNNNNNSENCFDITKSPKTALKDNHSDEKLAVELLVNLGKLLSGQTEDATTLQLLKSIGKALNIASNNCKIKSESQTDDISRNTQRITAVGITKSRRNVSLSNSKEATREQNLNSKFKPLEKTKRRSLSTIHSSNANVSNTLVNTKRKSTSELKDQKHFSNPSGLINTMANKKVPVSGVSNTKIDTAEFDTKNEKSLAIIDVKNKLKKKLSIVSGKGPLKAVHPVGVMQKKVSLGKQTAPISEATTPPKFHTVSSGNKVISSTPNSVIPSTPDGQNNGSSETCSKSTNKKRNFSCDISPVITQKGGSPNRPSKSSSARKSTPKRQQTDLSSIPKYCTPPRKLNASFNMSSHHQQYPQYLNKSLTGYQRYSPIRPKSAEKKLRSPLKDSNKIFTKVKPFKLISKFKGNTTGDFADKENYSE